MRSSLVALALAAAIALSPEAARAAGPDWRTAPIWGGDVRSLAVDPADPDRLYAGTSAGQVYLSRDGGWSWRDAGPPLPFPGWVVEELRFDPNQPSRLWAGLWGVWGSGHVALSDDGGKSWVSRAGGLPDDPVYSLALVPGREGHLYAGTISGVWGTTDGGKHWKRLTGALPELQKVTSLLVDPDQPETVIAGSWRQAYRSDDAGRTWAGVFAGMVLDSEVFSLTPIPGRPGEVWATTCGWVYRTLDRGGKWERFKEGFEERRTPSFAALADGRLLAGTVAGLHASEDGGKTWLRVGDPALSVLAITHHPARPERVVLGTEGAGIWLSNDGARTFQRAGRGMTNTRIGALAVADGELLVAVNHAGPLSGIHVSRDRGRSFDGPFAALPTVLDLAVHRGRAWAATERGLYRRLGESWHKVKELGDGRVEQVLSDGADLVARTPDALWELAGESFVRRPFHHGTPRSAALFGGALWVSDAKGLYRLTREANDTVAAPAAGGRLHRLEDRLLLWGGGGAWARGGGESLWVELPEKPSRVLATGDARYPVLLVAGASAKLYDQKTGTFLPVEVPVPVRDLSAALVLGGDLLLGTSGYGVLARPLEEPAAPVAAGTP